MSIEVDIFPTSPAVPTWGEVKSQFMTLLSNQADLAEQLDLRLLGPDELIRDDEYFIPESAYYLELSVPNTLGIVMSKGDDIDKNAYLEDYGRNLSTEKIADYVTLWSEAAYYFEVTSQAGRSEKEGFLFIALARAPANSCNGYVIVMHSSAFNLGVGVYSPDQLDNMQAKF